MDRSTKNLVNSLLNSDAFKQFKNKLLNIKYITDDSFSLKNEIERFYVLNNFNDLDQDEFYVTIKEFLKENLTSQFQRSNNQIVYPDTLSLIEQGIVRNFRNDLLNILQGYADTYIKHFKTNPSSFGNMRYVDYYIAFEEIKHASDSRLFHFYKELEDFKQKQIQFHSNEPNSTLLNYYTNANIAELAFPFIFNSSYAKESNGLFRFKLTLNHPSFNQEEIENLQFINNLIESDRLQCVDDNILFNGIKFYKCGVREDEYTPIDIVNTNLYTQLKNGESLREKQSQLAYNDEVQESVFTSRKIPLVRFSETNNDSIIETTLFTMNTYDVTFPIVIKQSIKSTIDDTCSIVLYLAEKDDISFATQLCRLDKDNPLNPWGTPSTHKQRGGERIEKECHAHQGSSLEQLLSNKGSYNIFQNYRLDNSLAFEELNAIFNDYCNIRIKQELVNEVIISTTQTNNI